MCGDDNGDEVPVVNGLTFEVRVRRSAMERGRRGMWRLMWICLISKRRGVS